MPGLITTPTQLAMLEAMKTLIDVDTVKVGLYVDIVGVGRPTVKSDFSFPAGANLALQFVSAWNGNFNKPNFTKASNSSIAVFDGDGLVDPVSCKGVVVIGSGADGPSDPVLAYYPFDEAKTFTDESDALNVVLQLRVPRDADYFSIDTLEGGG